MTPEAPAEEPKQFLTRGDREYLQFSVGLLERQLERQRCNYESMDTKGSILVGAGAVLLQLSLTILGQHWYTLPASVLFGGAAILGVCGIQFREWGVVPDPQDFAKNFKHMAMDDAVAGLIDSMAEIYGNNERIIQAKARLLSTGFWLIAIGTGWACFSLLVGKIPHLMLQILHVAIRLSGRME